MSILKRIKKIWSDLLFDKSIMNDSEVFCMAPWVHIHVLPHGKVFPCCASGHLSELAIGDMKKDPSLESAWNSPQMKQLRKDMLEGKKNPLCERCHKYQELGKESERFWFNKEFSDHFNRVKQTKADGYLPVFSPPYIDIRFSNVCNLKCRICTHELSSAWYSDAKKLNWTGPDSERYIYPTQEQEMLWEEVRPLMKDVKRMHFAGGEPLLMEEHYQVLDALIEKGNTDVTLTYNTNFSKLKFKDKDVLDLWKHFKDVYVFASLDGMGEKGDYMRKGQKWDAVVKNRERLMNECNHVKFFIDSTVNVMNVMHMPDFFKSWVEKGYIAPENMNLYLLFDPIHYNIKGLPKDLKSKITEQYQNFEREYLDKLPSNNRDKVKKEFSAIIEFMNEEQIDVKKQLVRTTRLLDDIRNESFEEVFPELKSALN